MTRRYFISQLPEKGGIVALSEEEATHAAKVMRVKPGDPICAFDGRGHEAGGKIHSVERRQVYLELEIPSHISREPSVRVIVAASLPKGDRAKLLVEKLTELGVAELVPIECQRTQGRIGSGAVDKLKRYVIEASKQCERNQLMEIGPSCAFTDFIQRSEQLALVAGTSLLFAHPCEKTVDQAVGQISLEQAVLCVGPEGGFTDDEVARALAGGYQPVSLGKSILRVETAAAALVARLVIA